MGVSAGVDVLRKGRHAIEGPVALGIVQAKTHDELVGDIEAHIARFDFDLHGVGLAQQATHFY